MRSYHPAYKTATILIVIIRVEVNSTVFFRDQDIKSKGGKQLFWTPQKMIWKYQGKVSFSSQPIDLQSPNF